VQVIFTKDDLSKTLGEVLEAAGKNQIRIAETEKYPHVTFFFSGGREKEFINEKRLLVPSPKGGNLRLAARNERRGDPRCDHSRTGSKMARFCMP
jgi:hypothetical protein